MTKPIFKGFLSVSLAIMVLTTLLTVSAISCAPKGTDAGKIIVAVTILPQAGFVEAIGGDKVEVVLMVPPGASPHTYEVTPDQMVKLSKAKMYAKVGSPVEFELAWMDKLIAVNEAMLVVDCSQGIQLLEMDEHQCDHEHEHDQNCEHEQNHNHDPEHDHKHTGLDPHIWLSVKNAKVMVQNICDGLVQVDPANKAYYEKNCADYLEELRRLDSDIKDVLSGVKNRSFIVYHPAWGYFARDYNLIQIAVEQGGKEPDAAYIVRLIEEAKEHDIRVIFVSPQHSTSSAEVIAREIGGEVVIIEPLAKDFISNMWAIASAMKQAMQ